MDVDLTPGEWGGYSRFHKKIKRGRGGSPLSQGGDAPGKSMTYSRCGAWCGAEVVDLVGFGGETSPRKRVGVRDSYLSATSTTPHPQPHIY